MAQPRQYTQTNTFNDWTTTNPSDPHIGSKFDTEFTELKQNTDDLNTNIALIQRDDGKLKNESVHKDSFDQDALALIGASGNGFNVKGDWAASTAYVAGDIVNNNDATYLTATTSFTSASTFTADAANWTLIANSAISTSEASVNMASGDGSNRVFTTTYKYSNVKDIQVFISGVLVATNLYTISNSGGANNITFTTAPASGTNNVIIWGDSVVSQAAKADTLGYRDTANNHKTTASRWAYHTGSVVTDAETSSASTEYSAKEYAQGSLAAVGGSAKNWAISATTPTATATDASAREWAIGTSTHKNDASAKEYATSPQYDSVEGASEYSAKHYSAQAQDWAVKATIVRNDANSADVDFSSKEWATGQLAANTAGSAKQWSIGGGAFVEGTAVEGSNYSAKKYASDAATTYDNFDDRFLGAHTTAEREVGSGNIGKDHDGDALVTGALYFDTTLGVMKVWNGSLWKQLTPTTTEQTNIDTIVTGKDGTASTSGTTLNMALINTVADSGNLSNINTFANRYRVDDGTGDPNSNNDDGDLFWNTTTNELKIYNSTTSAWVVPYLDSASVDGVANSAAISMAIALG